MMRTAFLLVIVALWAGVAQADEPSRPKILGLSHIALYVHDIEKSRAFYHDYLGFEEPFHVDNPDGTLHLTWMKINDRQTIELFPEKQPGTLRVYHMSIETDDAEKLRAYLESKGVRVPKAVPKGKIGNSNFTIPDADGHMLEIVTYEPDGWTIREKGKHLPETRISDHMLYLIVPVSTFEKAGGFYKSILAFEELGKGEGWLRFKTPEGPDYLEFAKYADLPRAEQQGKEHHIGLEVPDLTKAIETLKSRKLPEGCKPASDVFTSGDGRKSVTLMDPDGTHIELVGR